MSKPLGTRLLTLEERPRSVRIDYAGDGSILGIYTTHQIIDVTTGETITAPSSETARVDGDLQADADAITLGASGVVLAEKHLSEDIATAMAKANAKASGASAALASP